jgi:hypothetical protein
LDVRQKRTRVIGGYDPQERGLEGLSIYFIFYLPIIVLMERIGYMSFFRKAMWFLVCK